MWKCNEYAINKYTMQKHIMLKMLQCTAIIKQYSCVQLISNYNWRDVQRKNVWNNVDLSSVRAPGHHYKKARTKYKHLQQNQTCRTTRRNTHL